MQLAIDKDCYLIAGLINIKGSTVKMSSNAVPLVTVILTSYNYAPFLRKAIQSVLDQTYSRFELIAVDDGSKDESPEILKSYFDPRLEVILQKNSGQASAWNTAFARSKGELIFFIDSDDWWAPEKIDRVVKMHEASDKLNCLIQHNMTCVTPTGEHPYRRILPSGDCFSEMQANGRISYFVTSSGLCVPRWVCDQIFPIPEVLRISPDAFLTRVAFTLGPVLSLPEKLAYLRLHGKNAGMTQPQVFHDDLRRKVIFPVLNARYREMGIDYEYKIDPIPSTSWLRRLARKMVR